MTHDSKLENMKQLIYHIIRWIPGIFLVLLTVASASAQKPVWLLEVDQCDTMEFSVASRPNIDDSHFVWEIFTDSTVNFVNTGGALDHDIAFVDGMYAGRKVRVTGLDPGRYFVRIMVWDEISCTNNLEMFMMDIVQTNLDFVLEGDSVCIGEPAVVKIVFTGVGPYTLDFTYGDALTGNVVNVNGIVVDGPEYSIPITDPLPAGETKFWVMNVTDGCRVNSYETATAPSTGIMIYPKPNQSKIYVKDD